MIFEKDSPDVLDQKRAKTNPILCTPIIRSPITDFFGISLHNQKDAYCRDFEFKLAKCAEAYGYYRGLLMCEKLIRDMSECITNFKQMSRGEVLHGEMTRQVHAGERKYDTTIFIPEF
ncbi:unnamed protein product [Xylocopa violacea]|uniref:COX assembly mitochondrial protein n=1 Tax=Xylocopa violacea TaxID=135666 RepID=A0ABP1PB38_XYLVO